MQKRKKYTRTFWAPEEIAQLKKLYPKMYSTDLANLLNREVSSVYRKANELGIKKSKSFMKKELQIQAERLRFVGVKGRFKKGHIPANAGKPMAPEVYEKTKATMFKIGHLPHNTIPGNGHIRTRKENSGKLYLFIKIGLNNWKHLHRHIYEQNFGSIPKGHCIWFTDGNPANCNLANLECITRAENARRNRAAFVKLPPELQEAKKLINQITKKIKQA